MLTIRTKIDFRCSKTLNTVTLNIDYTPYIKSDKLLLRSMGLSENDMSRKISIGNPLEYYGYGINNKLCIAFGSYVKGLVLTKYYGKYYIPHSIMTLDDTLTLKTYYPVGKIRYLFSLEDDKIILYRFTAIKRFIGSLYRIFKKTN